MIYICIYIYECVDGVSGNCHTIFVNADTAVAYAVGSNTCSGGLHMVDVSNPTTPQFLGCYSDDGYTHEVQCRLQRRTAFLLYPRMCASECNP
jgi:hypothetical protein